MKDTVNIGKVYCLIQNGYGENVGGGRYERKGFIG